MSDAPPALPVTVYVQRRREVSTARASYVRIGFHLTHRCTGRLCSVTRQKALQRVAGSGT